MLRLRPRLLPLHRLAALAILIIVLAFAGACNKASDLTKEVAYVNAPQVVLRDRLATIFEKRGIVKLGDKVYILNRNRRFAYVRTERGEEGWIADRYLVDSATYEQFEKLASDNTNAPVQARGTTRSTLNLHVAPGRNTEHLFRLNEGDRVEILKRATAERPGQYQPQQLKKAGATNAPPPPILEDWWLVRSTEGRVGWVLARMVYVDLPLDVAQYAEGQRIVSSFVLSKVQDGDKQVPQYLVMLTDNKDGLPYDFNQIRVFTWNLKRHRYETAYRERDLFGLFPVKVGTQDFGQDGGILPVFSFHVKDAQGNETERQYRMIGPIVRRIATPEQLRAEAEQRAIQKAAQRSELAGKKKKRR